ncbi:hypothetical protein KQI52_13245 [bacterium]|nr:hypothetical protein [bacterium]
MTSPRRAVPSLIALPLLVLLPLLILTACDNGSDGPTEPDPDPGDAAAAQAYRVEATLKIAFTDIQSRLNGSQAQLIGIDYALPGAGDVLEDLVEFSDRSVWAAGIVNDVGTVVRAYPDVILPVVGQSWGTRSEVDAALTEISLNLGPVRDLADIRSVIYTRTIGTATIEGVLFAAMDTDTLFTENVTFTGIDTVADQEFFALDRNGEILYTTSGGHVGEVFTNTATFSEDQVQVAELMIDPGNDTNTALLDFTGAPGGDGMRYVGWTQLQVIEDHIWVLAVTMVADE